ncbi:hypothetical protein K439DRAFT_1648162 [Ramaria rubella]|nr:hypothetical protein K439DRAFT_1648162 [Ramaria rubella]
MDSDDHDSLVSVRSVGTGPDTINKLVHRIRALTFRLLPVEVSVQSLKDPASKIITPRVISTYVAAAGDFVEALPFVLLRARQTFLRDASNNISDWDENNGRAVACEVLARRIVHSMGADRLTSIMSKRYRYREFDGDVSNPSSALEFAVDQHCTIFLSSNESQLVMNSLWEGRWVQQYTSHDDIHLRQPLERLDPRHQSFDAWECILYFMTLAFIFEGLNWAYLFSPLQFYTTTRLFSWRAGFTSFWTAISVITLALISTAFIFRVLGIMTDDENGALHLKSFQVLSCLITVFDGVKYIGTMQICVGRMLQESTIFFALLALLFAGFLQAMVALDASDGETERSNVLINTLVQALLQSPDFDKSGTNLRLTIYLSWNFANTVILLNILVSLFASAYQDVVDDAEAQYLAFFAGKTIAMIRAPDHYVYPPPFNVIETFLVAPWEFVISMRFYSYLKTDMTQLNKYVMLVFFCVPLSVLAFFESLDQKTYIRNWFGDTGLGDEESPEAQNPEVDNENGLKISKVEFKDLIKEFPNILLSSDEMILREIRALQHKVDELAAKVASKET